MPFFCFILRFTALSSEQSFDLVLLFFVFFFWPGSTLIYAASFFIQIKIKVIDRQCYGHTKGLSGDFFGHRRHLRTFRRCSRRLKDQQEISSLHFSFTLLAINHQLLIVMPVICVALFDEITGDSRLNRNSVPHIPGFQLYEYTTRPWNAHITTIVPYLTYFCALVYLLGFYFQIPGIKFEMFYHICSNQCAPTGRPHGRTSLRVGALPPDMLLPAVQ